MQMVEEKAVSPLVTVEKVAYIKSWYTPPPFHQFHLLSHIESGLLLAGVGMTWSDLQDNE